MSTKAKPGQGTVDRVSVRVSEALDLLLTENAALLYDTDEWPAKLELRWALKIAVEEGLAALIEAVKNNPRELPPMRFEAVPGPRRLMEYEQRLEAAGRVLAALDEHK
ncbi:MAG TPA: hypothetical protein VL200_09840 [Lacunisphaera sp.]|jgi:hypothetical protein|nr:hypothetical protein [Lacunisphaera sp.]